jgi:diacylglycerol O-acyltransferase / wax synthase
MRQLNSWDAAFLYGETNFAPMHICSVAHFGPGKDGQQLSLDDVRAALKRRMHLLPPLRQRVVYVPFGLGRPYWSDDREVNIDDHLHQVTLLPPGDRHQLAEQVSQIAARPLDLSRPLWEMDLIHGVEGDQTVLVTKFHHAAVDGASGADFIRILFDPAPETQPEPAPGPRHRDQVPRPWEMLLRGMAGMASYPMDAMRFQRRMLASLPHLARSAVPGKGGRLALPTILAPRTPFNGSLTPDRSWAFGEVPLDQVKAIKNALGGTVNDVVMSVCAGALRRWLLEHDALPGAPLVVMIPVSLRTEEERGTFGNRVSMMTSTLLTTVADPVERLRATAETAKAAKQTHSALGDEFLSGALQLAMPMMTAPGFRMAAEMPFTNVAHPSANLFISNVPGPPEPLYLAGKQMLTYYPAAFLPRGTGLNIVVLSYSGNIHFGLMACPQLVPDVWSLMGYVTEALNELAQAAEEAEGRKQGSQHASATKARANAAAPRTKKA